MVIAVDFDGTITKRNNFPEIGELKDYCIEALQLLRKQGHKLILWTCRTGSNLEAAVTLLREKGFEFDAVNEQLLTYGTLSNKVCADVYIDDNAWPFSVKHEDFWKYLYEHLMAGRNPLQSYTGI